MACVEERVERRAEDRREEDEDDGKRARLVNSRVGWEGEEDKEADAAVAAVGRMAADAEDVRAEGPRICSAARRASS